jgi:hypothetical protein
VKGSTRKRKEGKRIHKRQKDGIQKQKLEGFNYERDRIQEKNSRFGQGEK